MRAPALAGLSLCPLMLAGCTSPQEQHAPDQQRCAGDGFAPGTDAMAGCMRQASQQREAQDAARRGRTPTTG